MSSLDERELEREIQGIPPPKPPERVGTTGYTIRGVFRIPVMRDPSRVYVRFPDGGFIKALHDGNVSSTVETVVEVYQDRRGEWHVRAPGGIESAAYEDELGGGMYLPSHTHVSTEITDLLTYIFAYVLFRDGSNGMSGPLDMNSNPIREVSTIITGGTTPDASVAIQSDSTTKGWLPSRMTTTQRDAIASPATGIFIYNTTTSQLEFWNGTSWEAIGAGSYSLSVTDGTTTDLDVNSIEFIGADVISVAPGIIQVDIPAGFVNPMTTIGDLLYVNGSGNVARLPIGTSGQVLTVVGGVPAWSTPASGGDTTSGILFDGDYLSLDGEIMVMEV